MTDRRHGLPFSMHHGRFTIQGQPSYEDTPYRLNLGGQGGGMYAPLTRADLEQLRDGIDDILAAPFRVLVPNPREHDAPWLADAIRDRLDRMHAEHQRMEVAALQDDAFVSAAEAWAWDVDIPVLYYDTAADMFADGGDRVLLVAGPGALELSRQAREANLGLDLIRAPEGTL
jgi:hypothetical protein